MVYVPQRKEEIQMNRTIFIPIFLLFFVEGSSIAYSQPSFNCGSNEDGATLRWDSVDYPSSPATPQNFLAGQSGISIDTAGVDSADEASGGFTLTNSFNESINYILIDADSSGQVTLTFEQDAANVQFSIFDVDVSDEVTISGTIESGTTSNLGYVNANGGPTFTPASQSNQPGVTINGSGGDGSGGEGTVNVTFVDPVQTITIDFDGPIFGLGDISYCSPSFGPGNLDACSNGLPVGSEGLVLVSTENGAGVDQVYSVNLDTGAAIFLFEDPTADDINAMATDAERAKVYYSNNAGDGFILYDPLRPAGTRIVRPCFNLPAEVIAGGTIADEGATFQGDSIYFTIRRGDDSPEDNDDEIWRARISDPDATCEPSTTINFYQITNTNANLGDLVITDGIMYIADRFGADADSAFEALDLLSGQFVDSVTGSQFNGQIGLSAQGNTAIFTDTGANPQFGFYDNTVGPNFGNQIGTFTSIGADFPPDGPIVDSSTCINPESDLEPVTLSSFSSSYSDGGLQLDWSTSTETINMGFNIYAYIEGERVILNDQLIPSNAPNSVEPQYYEHVVFIPDNTTQIGISSVDINGHEDYFGPYEVGGSYGVEPLSSEIDWKRIKEQYNQNMAGRGFEMREGKMRAPAPAESSLFSSFISRVGSGESPVCNIAVNKEGMYRVRQRDLRNAGCDFRGVDVNDIAVSFKGEAVSRRINRGNGTVRNNTNIFFYGETPRGRDYLYTTENIYQVNVNPALVKTHKNIRRPRRNELGRFAADYIHSVNIEKNLIYDFVSPYGINGEIEEIDPWYEDFIFAGVGTPSSNFYSIPVLDDIDTTKNGELKVRLIGTTDFPENQVDHEARLKLNGNDQGTFTAEGRLNWLIEVPVAGSEILPGINELEIELTGGLGIIDFVGTDSYGLSYYRPTEAINNKLNFYGEDTDGYTVSGFDEKNVQVYAEHDGELYRLRSRKQNTANGYSVSFSSVGSGAAYWVSPRSEFNTGVITKADEGDIKIGNADVLIVTHPALTGSELDSYVNYVNNLGLTTKVVNVLNIYDGFGYGMPTPEGIKNYIEFANNSLGTEYVVIIGGTTTEYPDPATLESVQYVPTDFQPTQDIISFTPCDGCMADFNGDFVPELKIFRIPSRQVSDTGAVADKSNAYNTDSSVLMLAEHTQDQNYGAQLDSASSVLGGYDQSRVYLSDIASENGISVDQAVCVAQFGADCPDCQAGMPCQSMTGIIDQINNNNQRLLMFNGHGSVLSWTFNSLFTNIVAEGLTNTEPNLVIPMACYTTYYQDPGTSSLADQLLFNPNGGSVAVSGSSTLSSLRENGTFASSILGKMCDGTTTLAEAVFETKQENPGLTDQVINWDLIGNGFVTIAKCAQQVIEPNPPEVSSGNSSDSIIDNADR